MKKPDDTGSVVPVYLSMLFILLIASCAIVYLGGAYLLRTTLNNDLALARHAVINPAFALPMKNSDTPGYTLTRTLADTLNKNGAEGDLTVWFYEAPISDTGENHRAFAWTAQIKDIYTPPVSLPPISVSADITDSYLAYSGGTSWRPQNFEGGACFKYTTDTTNQAGYIAEQKMTLDAMPAPLKSALSNRLDEIKHD